MRCLPLSAEKWLIGSLCIFVKRLEEKGIVSDGDEEEEEDGQRYMSRACDGLLGSGTGRA